MNCIIFTLEMRLKFNQKIFYWDKIFLLQLPLSVINYLINFWGSIAEILMVLDLTICVW